MGIAKKYGYELWAVIDPEASAIKEVSTGFSRSHAVGVYGGTFSKGDVVWHTHPSGKGVQAGDWRSAYHGRASMIFAAGASRYVPSLKLSGYDLRAHSLPFASPTAFENYRGSWRFSEQVYSGGSWSTRSGKFSQSENPGYRMKNFYRILCVLSLLVGFPTISDDLSYTRYSAKKYMEDSENSYLVLKVGGYVSGDGFLEEIESYLGKDLARKALKKISQNKEGFFVVLKSYKGSLKPGDVIQTMAMDSHFASADIGQKYFIMLTENVSPLA